MAEELVIMRDKQAVTTSLQVAESFGKKHYHIMDSIRKLTIENSIVEKMFVKETYMNKQNHEQPMYYMNRDGFTLLAMGLTGKKALEFKLSYIDAFNKMEDHIKADSRGLVLENQKLKEEVDLLKDENLSLLRENNKIQGKYIEVLESSVSLQNKVNSIDSIAEPIKSETSTSKQLSFYAKGRTVYLSEFAKAFSELHNVSLGRNSLFKFLRDHKIFRGKRSPKYNQPTKQYEDKGYFKVTDSKTGDYKVTKLTYNGQVWLDKFLQGNKKLSKYLK